MDRAIYSIHDDKTCKTKMEQIMDMSIYYIHYEEPYKTNFVEESLFNAARHFGIIDDYAIKEKLDGYEVWWKLLVRLKSDDFNKDYKYLSDKLSRAKELYAEEFDKKNLKVVSFSQTLDDYYATTTFEFNNGEELSYKQRADELTAIDKYLCVRRDNRMQDKLANRRYWQDDYIRAIAVYFNNNYLYEHADATIRDMLLDINDYIIDSQQIDVWDYFNVDIENLDEKDTTEECYINNTTHVIIKHKNDNEYYLHRLHREESCKGFYLQDCWHVGNEEDVAKLQDKLRKMSEKEKHEYLEEKLWDEVEEKVYAKSN